MIDNFQKGSVKFRQCDAFYELIHGEVFNPVSHEASLATYRAGQEGFAASGLAINKDVLSPVYEAAVRDFQQCLFCEIPFC